jgi:hypothetical protein
MQRIGEFAAANPSTRVLLAPSPNDAIAAPVSQSNNGLWVYWALHAMMMSICDAHMNDYVERM